MSIAPASLEFQLAHLHDDRSLGLKVTFVIAVIVATVMVALRIASRRISKAPLKADDYTIIAALILWYGLSGINFCHVYRWGLGKHEASLQVSQLIGFLKGLYAYSLFYTPIILLAKLSLLCLYHRIFVVPKFQWHAKFWILFTALFGISTWFVDLFFCKPIGFFWDKSIPGGKCIDTYRYYMACAALNVFLDVVILVLPMPMVWALQIPRRQKWVLVGIFTIGGMCCLATVFRLVTFPYIDNNDFPWTYTDCSYFTNAAEVPLAFICACLPVMRPLIRKFVPVSLTKRSKKDSSNGWGNSSNTYNNSSQGTWHSIDHKQHPVKDSIDDAENGVNRPVKHSDLGTSLAAWHETDNNVSDSMIPLKAIHVQNEVNLDRTAR